MMRTAGIGWLVLSALAAIVAAMLAIQIVVAEAEPNETALEISVPAESRVGDEATLEARLTDEAGKPISGEIVGFYSLAQFAGYSGEVKLGEVATGDDGVAQLSHLVRREGEIRVAARFEGNEDYAPSREMDTMMTLPGEQIYQSTAGVHIPGLSDLNVGILVAVLGIVWFIYGAVMVRLFLIGRASLSSDSKEEGRLA
jgi:hypothetical protein